MPKGKHLFEKSAIFVVLNSPFTFQPKRLDATVDGGVSLGRFSSVQFDSVAFFIFEKNDAHWNITKSRRAL